MRSLEGGKVLACIHFQIATSGRKTRPVGDYFRSLSFYRHLVGNEQAVHAVGKDEGIRKAFIDRN